ncbi:hypothetical protein IT409_01105 [Candidatus Falkowbacteria bacterium]|nr:hypothetical protein [Candidatus Falkowbacteria bacterium]
MQVIIELHALIDASALDNKSTIKQQLEVLATLPGSHNEQVFSKLLELAKHDPSAVTVFIDQFIKTSRQLLGR